MHCPAGTGILPLLVTCPCAIANITQPHLPRTSAQPSPASQKPGPAAVLWISGAGGVVGEFAGAGSSGCRFTVRFRVGHSEEEFCVQVS